MSLQLELVYPVDGVGGERAVWSTGLSHNFRQMADACGLGVLWDRPAIELVAAEALEGRCWIALDLLRVWPERFKSLSSLPGGWSIGRRDGRFDQWVYLTRWVEELQRGCQKYPDAGIRVAL